MPNDQAMRPSWSVRDNRQTRGLAEQHAGTVDALSLGRLEWEQRRERAPDQCRSLGSAGPPATWWALLTGKSEIPAISRELASAGVDVAAVEIRCGAGGAAILDEHGRCHGLRGRIVRAFQRVGYGETALAIYDNGRRDGDLLLRVPARPVQRAVPPPPPRHPRPPAGHACHDSAMASPRAGTAMSSSSPINCGLSPAWPGVSRTDSGRPRRSTLRCVFVLHPPRERPRA
jgi:hypothetical protein